MDDKSFAKVNLESDYVSPLSNQNESEVIVSQEGSFRKLDPSAELKGKRALCPIYFRLSPDTYMKFVEGGELIRRGEIEELSERGIYDLYVRVGPF